MVLSAVVVCWSPWTILSLFEYNGYFNTQAEAARLFLISLGFTNSVINPLIYVWNIPEFKLTLKRLALPIRHLFVDNSIGPDPGGLYM